MLNFKPEKLMSLHMTDNVTVLTGSVTVTTDEVTVTLIV